LKHDNEVDYCIKCAHLYHDDFSAVKVGRYVTLCANMHFEVYIERLVIWVSSNDEDEFNTDEVSNVLKEEGFQEFSEYAQQLHWKELETPILWMD
jgi:hypothetical protein